MMTHANAGWLYYRRYYRDIDFLKSDQDENNQNAFADANRSLTQLELADAYTDPLEGYLDGLKTFDAITLYPGLLIGSGYQHETNRLGEWKLGFFFDHSIGLPVIPGSSVKGMLRAAFRYPALIKSYLQKPDWGEAELQVLEMDWFEGKDWDETQKEFVPRPMAAHDTFFDAMLIQHTKGEPILQADVLTPHHPGNPEGAFKNPIPIGFVKVAPQVRFRFRFRFHPLDTLGITIGDKVKLAQELILAFGLGAKTAVGYGQFEFTDTSLPQRPKPAQLESPRPSEQLRQRTKPQDQAPKRKAPDPNAPLPAYEYKDLKHAYKRGKHIIGKVIDNTGGQLKVNYHLDGESREALIRYPGSAKITVGRKIRLKVIEPGTPGGQPGPRFGYGGYA